MRPFESICSGFNIKKLGIRNKIFDKILVQAKKTNGVILNTGPTGMKTTTLYGIS